MRLDSAVKYIKQIVSFKKIFVVRDSGGRSWEFAKKIVATYPQLERLYLHRVTTKGVDFKKLADAKKLSFLAIDVVPSNNETNGDFPQERVDEVLEDLRKFQSLTEL